ncbi:MAG: type II toxin-antitoxin system VapC family toxin [Thermoanaerobaculia bacterium]
MPFVVDCSMTMAWVFADEATPATDALRDSLVSDLAIVPGLWPVEVANVLHVATRRGRIHKSDWTKIRKSLAALPIEIDPETSARAWPASLPLAYTHKLSAYDAVYLELAVRMKLPLATLDKDLRAACRAVKVPVLG